MLESTNQPEEELNTISKPFSMLVLGFIMILIGVVTIVVTAVISGGSGSVGGVVFIGPIPIVFGAGPSSNWLIIISVILAVVTLGLFLVYTRRSRRRMD